MSRGYDLRRCAGASGDGCGEHGSIFRLLGQHVVVEFRLTISIILSGFLRRIGSRCQLSGGVIRKTVRGKLKSKCGAVAFTLRINT